MLQLSFRLRGRVVCGFRVSAEGLKVKKFAVYLAGLKNAGFTKVAEYVEVSASNSVFGVGIVSGRA